MKLIALLFLSSRLVLSLTEESLSQGIDCNDPDLFTAVDTALKKYNDRIQTGNQFILYRVTEATKMDGTDPFYSFKYQIKEGDCSAESGTSWQNCSYKDSEDAATGECTATVGERKNKKFLVATQTCQITPVAGPVTTATYSCRGCTHPISTSDPDLEPVLRHALKHFNSHSKHSHLFALREVKSAHRQVVSGWNYDVIYSIEQTNCSKEDFPSLTPECQPLLNGDFGECTDQAYVNISLSVVSFSQKCNIFQVEDFVKPSSEKCLGCPEQIPVDSPELKEVLHHSIRHLNAESNGNFYFKIDSVTKASKQVVSGLKYYVTFVARETICSKDSNTELIETCDKKNFGQILTCDADVIIVSWVEKVLPTIKCQPLQETSMKKRPPGFSPFRTKINTEAQDGKTVSPSLTLLTPIQDEEQESGKEQRPTHGQDLGFKRKIKHDHDRGQKNQYDQSHDNIKGPGFSHGHQKQHGHQQEHGYNLQLQVRSGLGLGHQKGHALTQGHKHQHGRDHGRHKNRDKNSGKYNGWSTEHLTRFSEDSTTASIHTPDKTEGPTPIPSVAQREAVVTFPDFHNSDLTATMMPNILPTPTGTDNVWIPNIQVEPYSFSFSLIPDFPETASPKCPGHPWKPANRVNPIVVKENFPDFDLSDALY